MVRIYKLGSRHGTVGYFSTQEKAEEVATAINITWDTYTKWELMYYEWQNKNFPPEPKSKSDTVIWAHENKCKELSNQYCEENPMPPKPTFSRHAEIKIIELDPVYDIEKGTLVCAESSEQ